MSARADSTWHLSILGYPYLNVCTYRQYIISHYPRLLLPQCLHVQRVHDISLFYATLTSMSARADSTWYLIILGYPYLNVCTCRQYIISHYSRLSLLPMSARADSTSYLIILGYPYLYVCTCREYMMSLRWHCIRFSNITNDFTFRWEYKWK